MADQPNGHVVGFFGPFASRALIEVSADTAMQMVEADDVAPAAVFMLDAVDGEIASLRERDEALADSALAALARTLAYELANPHNSATSKAACARELREALDRLLELAPAAQESDRLDEVKNKREDRRRRAADA